MNLSYLARLCCLGLASFFLVHLAASVIVALLARLAIRTAPKLAPHLASRLLLTLRLLPFGLPLFAVIALCVPSYLWLEPKDIVEPVGYACLFMALLGAFIPGIGIAQGARAAVRSRLLMSLCRVSGRQMCLAAGNPPAWVVEGPTPFLALSGIIRPRLIISKAILDSLSQEELSVVLEHERAHRASRDNLKRLCIFLTPRVMPFLNVFKELERSWISFAEYAADTAAVADDPRRSVALAAALVHVARLGTASRFVPSSISFLEDTSVLSARVDRLLTGSSSLEPRHSVSWYKFALVLILAGSLAAIYLRFSTFRFVQSLLERLIH